MTHIQFVHGYKSGKVEAKVNKNMASFIYKDQTAGPLIPRSYKTRAGKLSYVNDFIHIRRVVPVLFSGLVLATVDYYCMFYSLPITSKAGGK